MKVKPDLSFWKLWNISFGFFGVQIAYALQSANISRIFSTSSNPQLSSSASFLRLNVLSSLN